MIKVAFVLMQFPAPSETFAGRDIRALDRNGAKVDVYRMRGLNDGEAEGIRGSGPSAGRLLRALLGSEPGLIRVMNLGLRVLGDSGTPVRERIKCLLLLPAAASLANLIARRQPDVLHLFWGHYPAMVAILSKPMLRNARISMFLGAYDLEYRLGVSRWAAQMSDCVITHARANTDAIRTHVGDGIPIKVVHRGIDTAKYPSDSEAVSKDAFMILTAGRLIESKGFDEVLQAFATVHARQPRCRLQVAGDGPDRGRLERLTERLGISSSVKFLGWLTEDAIRTQMLNAKVFVLLSRKPGERLPNVVKEAMAAACVCIVSEHPGLDELIQHGLDGYIVAADNMDMVAGLIRRHVGIKEMEAVQQRAANAVRDRFDVDASARAYMDIWSNRV